VPTSCTSENERNRLVTNTRTTELQVTSHLELAARTPSIN